MISLKQITETKKMKTGTKEFYEMQKDFEKSMKENTFFPSLDMSKVEKDAAVPIGYFYNSGLTNQLFHAFMVGYGCGRLNYME